MIGGSGLSGCMSAATGDDDPLEHQVPAHRPPDLSAAAEQIPLRWTALRSMPDGADRTARWTELGDILRWLPEIAGASDLPRPEWDEVARIARELETLYEQETRAASPNPANESHRESLLQQLSRIAPPTGEPQPPANAP